MNRKRESYVASVLGSSPEMAERAKRLASEIDELETAAAAAGARVSERSPKEILGMACERLPGDAALLEFAAYDRTARGATAAATPSLTALVTRSPGCRVTAIDLGGGALSVVRPVYAGKAFATVHFSDTPALLSIRPNAFHPQENPAAGTVQSFSPEGMDPAAWTLRVKGFEATGGGTKDVAEASIIVSGGRGIDGPRR